MEEIITIIAGLVTIVAAVAAIWGGTRLLTRRKKLTQNVANNSIGIQSGRDTKIMDSNEQTKPNGRQ